jgi:hypothetical protein
MSDMLTDREMTAIENVLVKGIVTEDDRDLLATLRYEFRCDNHSLHHLWSVQKGTLGDDKKSTETPVRR